MNAEALRIGSTSGHAAFSRESVAEVLSEIKPLLAQHYREIAHFQDIPLVPDYDRYRLLEEGGRLRIFTARVERQLAGYAIYGVEHSLHYSTSIQAMQDILYLDPAYRRGRIGWRLIEFADERLRAEGVQVVLQHVKAKHNFGPLLERIGYQLIDHIYARRLD